MLMLIRPRSVADTIKVATELFSTEASSVWTVSGSSTGGASELEARVKSLESKLDKVLTALKKNDYKNS